VSWGEVSACAEGAPELRFTWREVLARVDTLGDLFEPVLTLQQTLPGG